MTREELVKLIIEDAKAEGLEIAEDAAGKVVKLAFKIVDRVVEFTPTQLDNLIWAPIRPMLKGRAMALVDKIDGKEG
jgi:hypothetical protein